MTPLAYCLAVIGSITVLSVLSVCAAFLFESWQNGKDIDESL